MSGQLGYPSSVPDTQKRVESLLASGDHAIFVAEHSENQIIAWIHAYTRQSLTSGDLAEIGGLIVSKEFRGKGIGRRLLSAVETWALGKNRFKLRVRSQIQREDARQFYSDMGFAETKRQVVFAKTLKNRRK